jgi:hypothetical protein
MVFFYSSFLFPCNFNSNLKMISKLLDLNPLFTFFIISLHVFAIQNNGSVLCKYCNNKVNLDSGLTYPILFMITCNSRNNRTKKSSHVEEPLIESWFTYNHLSSCIKNKRCTNFPWDCKIHKEKMMFQDLRKEKKQSKTNVLEPCLWIFDKPGDWPFSSLTF